MEKEEQELIEERRLVSTLITGKSHKKSFTVAFGTVLFMALVSQFYWSNPFGWSELLPAVNRQVFIESQWWRVFTAIFIHADFEHFLSNMYMLSIFSFFIFGYFGFSVYPLFSFLAAGLVNAVALLTYEPDIRLLGASGLVYFLGGFWLTMYFFIQRQYKVINRLLRITSFAAMIFFPTTFVPNVSYRTHAIGFVMGLLMATVYFYMNKKKIRSYEVCKVTYVENEIKF